MRYFSVIVSLNYCFMLLLSCNNAGNNNSKLVTVHYTIKNVTTLSCKIELNCYFIYY